MIDGLAPGSEREYQVALDGAVRWPAPGDGFPPSVLRTRCPDRPVRIAFGSCRAAGDVAQPDPAQPDPAQPDPAHVDALAGTAVASLAGAARPAISWHITQGPWFENMLATLEYDARTARIRFDRTAGASSGTPHLTPAYELRLT